MWHCLLPRVFFLLASSRKVTCFLCSCQSNVFLGGLGRVHSNLASDVIVIVVDDNPRAARASAPRDRDPRSGREPQLRPQPGTVLRGQKRGRPGPLPATDLGGARRGVRHQAPLNVARGRLARRRPRRDRDCARHLSAGCQHLLLRPRLLRLIAAGCADGAAVLLRRPALVAFLAVMALVAVVAGRVLGRAGRGGGEHGRGHSGALRLRGPAGHGQLHPLLEPLADKFLHHAHHRGGLYRLVQLPLFLLEVSQGHRELVEQSHISLCGTYFFSTGPGPSVTEGNGTKKRKEKGHKKGSHETFNKVQKL
eukprot:Hpha_TRINITY_DN13164_c0_g1::TRINITY_DN13164_c0_g1_i1::g.113844::m.113844